MQKLQFESAWDKTLSAKDRERIKNVFFESNSSNDQIQFTPLWQAFNHKGELLVTTLIQNFNEKTLSFQNKKLLYLENNIIMAEHTFSLPNLLIDKRTSMPWTFIFPVESFLRQADFKNGYIKMED